MATGGVFQLIANDGKQDRMLMATQLLRNRLDAIRVKRKADPSITDETPTLLDIERTHVLFTNAHFKPFVALGFEYNKVNAGSGTVQLGGDVQFSIPQFGDFFNDMCLFVKLDAPTLSFNSSVTLNKDKGKIRYCDYPGERFLQKVSFEVNGNPLDSYTSDSTVMHRKFNVQPNKKLAWDRCMGQEVPKKGYMESQQIDPLLTGPLDNKGDDHRVLVDITDGYQTPKSQQTGITMLIPLLFWCNQDPRLAVPSVAIPYGQRFINVSLATSQQMLGYVPRDKTSTTEESNAIITAPNISQMSLYINNIFVNPEIHQIFIKRIGFTLIRVHRHQSQVISTSESETLLQNLKWPIETMFVGLRPQSQKLDVQNWHKFTSIEEKTISMPNVASTESTLNVISSAGVVTAVSPVWATAQASFENSTKTIDRITISAHGISLYNDIPADFFNHYTTYTFGGPNIRAPDDEGVLMIPFNLYPGTYQPSGHVNISRAREFYIKLSSSVIGSQDGINPPVTGELVVVASAINFLLISDGSAVLRYST